VLVRTAGVRVRTNLVHPRVTLADVGTRRVDLARHAALVQSGRHRFDARVHCGGGVRQRQQGALDGCNGWLETHHLPLARSGVGRVVERVLQYGVQNAADSKRRLHHGRRVPRQYTQQQITQ
jgi:hypothetical protein